MAADEINQAGGVSVGGVMRPIQLVKVDTNELVSTPDAASAMERAITVNKADFIIGAWNSEPVLAMMDIAADYKKIFISMGVSQIMSSRVKKNYDRYKYWFRAYSNSLDSVPYYLVSIPQFVSLVKTELGIGTPRVAVIVEKVAAWDPLLPYIEKSITAAGGTQVGAWRPSPMATDVSAELLAAKDAGAQIIYHIMYGAAGIVIAKQWDELKIPASLIGVNGQVAYPTFMKTSNGAGNYVETMGSVRAAVSELSIPWWRQIHQAVRARAAGSLGLLLSSHIHAQEWDRESRNIGFRCCSSADRENGHDQHRWQVRIPGDGYLLPSR